MVTKVVDNINTKLWVVIKQLPFDKSDKSLFAVQWEFALIIVLCIMKNKLWNSIMKLITQVTDGLWNLSLHTYNNTIKHLAV